MRPKLLFEIMRNMRRAGENISQTPHLRNDSNKDKSRKDWYLYLTVISLLLRQLHALIMNNQMQKNEGKCSKI